MPGAPPAMRAPPAWGTALEPNMPVVWHVLVALGTPLAQTVQPAVLTPFLEELVIWQVLEAVRILPAYGRLGPSGISPRGFAQGGLLAWGRWDAQADAQASWRGCACMPVALEVGEGCLTLSLVMPDALEVPVGPSVEQVAAGAASLTMPPA